MDQRPYQALQLHNRGYPPKNNDAIFGLGFCFEHSLRNRFDPNASRFLYHLSSPVVETLGLGYPQHKKK